MLLVYCIILKDQTATNRMATGKPQSFNSLLTVNKCFIQLLLFWFHLFRSADKIYEDEAVVLVLPPHSCNVTARTF